MADTPLTDTDAKAEFWKSLKHSNTGMLGLDRPGYHSQPMTGFSQDNDGRIWFFSRDDSDLAGDVAGSGQSAMFTYQSKDQEVFACIHGQLSADHDRAKIDEFWNPVVAAWFPDGKEDPHLTLLRFDGADGQIWLAKSGPVKFAYEIVKANITDTTPDIGGTAKVDLGR